MALNSRIFLMLPVILTGSLAISQTLNVQSFDLDGNGEAYAFQNCPPVFDELKDHNTVLWIQGGTTWFGQPYDYLGGLSYQAKVSNCGTVSANNSSHLFLDGDGSRTVSLDWQNWASVYALMEGPYYAEADNTFWFDVDVEIAPGGGFNPGDPVTLYFYYRIFGAGLTDHEAMAEDPITTNNTFTFNGNDILGGGFDFNNPPGPQGWNRVELAGTMNLNVGDVIPLSFFSFHDIEINPPGTPYQGGFRDFAKANLKGYLVLSFDSLAIPPQFQPNYYPRIEFSLDIGSDAERSDPAQNGNEVFDPGDAYLMRGPHMFSPFNGVKDDNAMIFGFDPAPDPNNPASAVPCGVGPYQPDLYFDLDGMDNLQVSLTTLSYGPGQPSIGYFNDSLILLANNFLVSYDDDGPENWSYNSFGFQSVPVNSQSPFGFDTYGKSSRADEVVAVDLDAYIVPSFPFTLDSLWNETDIHPNLAPNPDLAETEDNDVDALDYFPNQYINGFFYFSVDSEATFNHPIVFGALNPGSVYQLLSPGNFVEVVNPVIHLGLLSGTDINAFTFGWVWDINNFRLGLALLFSVDVDDWTTSADESGGKDPAMIYYSFLDGTHHEFMAAPLKDNIDALTIVPGSFNGYLLPPTPGCNAPTSLVVAVSSAFADLMWTEPAPPPLNGYEVELYDINNVIIQSATLPAGTNFYHFIGLNPNSTYTAIVRSNCGGGLYAEVAITFTTQPIDGDYGDAPEGSIAYPALGVFGNFPTCTSLGIPGSYIVHEVNPVLFLGPAIDYETDGNAGMCPAFTPNQYNQDECFQDPDAGLILPVPHTITGTPGSETVVPCISGSVHEPWKTCRMAVWGVSVDIHVENMTGTDAYFNLLVDWDQNGEWIGSVTCPDGSVAEEHAVVNLAVPAGFSGPLSQLNPPKFRIGSNEGYVWTRFTVTEIPVPAGWYGQGIFSSGETEDYLIAVEDPNLQGDVSIDNVTFASGYDDCTEAQDDVVMSNSTVESGANVVLVAGNSIRILPDSQIKSGAQFLATIDIDGNYCSNFKSLLIAEDDEIADEKPAIDKLDSQLFKVYPNPTSGAFTLELFGFDEHSRISIEVFGTLGERIMGIDSHGEMRHVLDLSGRQPGMYFIRVAKNAEIGVEKLILK